MKIFWVLPTEPTQAPLGGVGVEAVAEVRGVTGQVPLKPGLGAVAAVAGRPCLGSRGLAAVRRVPGLRVRR